MKAVQCKMARVALGLGVRDLAKLAGMSPDTVTRHERGEELKQTTVDAMRAALEAAGVEFIPENGGGPGVRLRPGGLADAADCAQWLRRFVDRENTADTRRQIKGYIDNYAARAAREGLRPADLGAAFEALEPPENPLTDFTRRTISGRP